jgi:hypothetical protein
LRTDVELAIGLPLDVAADKLKRIEADLRLLNMKTVASARAGDNGRPGAMIEARIESLYEALDSIRSLVSDIEADIRRKPGSDRDD